MSTQAIEMYLQRLFTFYIPNVEVGIAMSGCFFPRGDGIHHCHCSQWTDDCADDYADVVT